MATFNTAFGSLPGTNEMMGTTNTTGGGQQTTQNQTQQTTASQTGSPQQTFAQLQKQGMARPAPAAPQAQAFQQYGGSQQGQQMRQQLQQQLQQFNQAPSRFDTQAFQQIRGAQAANIQSDFAEQQRQLNEDLARRGLSASNIAGSGLARLGGAQSRALADLDSQLLQRAAETQAQDRAQLLQAGQGFAELAGSQDLSEFEANRVAQAATFENDLRAAQFGQQQYEQGTQQALQAAQAEQGSQQFGSDLALRLGELTGQVGGTKTLGATQQEEQARQFNLQQALQQQLGVGQLNVSQGELALRQQQVNEEARQFGLSLNEQQSARLQQYGISVQELGIERDKVINQNQQAGRQISEVEAQNRAQNNLEQARINEAIAARNTGIAESAAERNLRSSLQGAEARSRLEELTAQRTTQYGLAETQALAEMQRLRESNTAEYARQQALLAAQASEGMQARNLQSNLTNRELNIRENLGGQEIGAQQALALAQANARNNELYLQLAALLQQLSK